MAEQETQTGQPGNLLEGGTFNLNPGPMDGPKDKRGFRVDFNLGVRLEIPPGPQRRVRLTDQDTALVVYDGPVDEKQILSTDKKYFVRWKVEVWEGEKQVFSHAYDAKGKDVLIEVCSIAMGDTLAFLPYARLFKERHGCRRVYVVVQDHMMDLVKANYPDLQVAPRGKRPPGIYASYYMGNFYPSSNRNLQPYNWKMTGLQRCGAAILGLPMEEERPVLKPSGAKRPVAEPYVCIAAQATAQCKYWNHPRGWLDMVAYLKSIGYRVLCIDKDAGYGTGGYVNTIPWGAEDFTGARPLAERVDVLSHADFFIGLTSGISWLAWGTGVPVVLIAGFTAPWNEFYTPYRIINTGVCNSCFNDGPDFDMGAFDWCPQHHDELDRRYECTRGISPEHVIQTVQRLMADYHLDPKKGNREELGQ